MSKKVELNKHGINKKIKANILSDEEMKRIGFTYHGDELWYFGKMISNADISFGVRINKNNIEDLSIDILDENFCQPYDYQDILENNSKQQFALKIKEKVEYWMKYLQDNGVLSGHEYEEYI